MHMVSSTQTKTTSMPVLIKRRARTVCIGEDDEKRLVLTLKDKQTKEGDAEASLTKIRQEEESKAKSNSWLVSTNKMINIAVFTILSLTECFEGDDENLDLVLPLIEKEGRKGHDEKQLSEIGGDNKEIRSAWMSWPKNKMLGIAVFTLLSLFLLLADKTASSPFPFIQHQCTIDSSDVPFPKKKNLSKNDSAAHVVYAADQNQLRAMRASIISLLSKTKSPHDIHLHFMLVHPTAKNDIISPTLQHWIHSKGANLHFHSYNAKDVKKFMNPHITRTRLNNPDNFVRFILADKLPHDVEGCLWLDADTIVNGDILPFFRERRRPKKSEEGSSSASYALSAFRMVGKSLDVIDEETRSKMRDAGATDLAPSLPSFNAGVLYLNLEEWRQQNVTSQIEYYSKLNAKLNLWPKRGSQPPLQLALGGDRFEQLDEEMYADCLGCQKGGIMKQDALFLHWNGVFKPWKIFGFYKSYWRPHDLNDFHLCLDMKKTID